MSKNKTPASDLISFKNSQGLKARGTLLKLSQNYIVFEVYNPYSIVQLSETLSELTINRSGKEIYNGKAVVINIVSTGIILIVSATLSDSGWESTIDINSKEQVQEEINHLITNFENEQKINPEIKMNILAIRSFLSDLVGWLEKLEPSFTTSSIKLDEKLILNYFSSLFTKLTDLFRQSSELLVKTKEGQNQIYKKFIHDHLHHFIMSSPFAYRAYSKPLGFAGDYMMMHMIQRDSAEGSGLYAKFINIFYAYIPLSRSVNNRTKRLIEIITEGVKKAEIEGRDFHSLSIGCGPALEIKKFIESNNPKVKCHFHILDFNQETLDFARSEAEKVIGQKQFKIIPRLDSVHSLLKKSVNKEIEDQRYDFVYCSGLFDYLSDKVCSKLTRMFFDMTKDGGKVLVTNMHSNDIDRYIVEVLLEWYLIYRDEKNMAAFVPGLGEQKLYTDSTGINLCLEITKI